MTEWVKQARHNIDIIGEQTHGERVLSEGSGARLNIRCCAYNKQIHVCVVSCAPLPTRAVIGRRCFEPFVWALTPVVVYTHIYTARGRAVFHTKY